MDTNPRPGMDTNTPRLAPLTGQEDAEALATRLGFFTEAQVCKLGAFSAETLKNRRKRGEGPPYVQFGNRPLYPTEDLAEFLKASVKHRSKPSSRDQL